MRQAFHALPADATVPADDDLVARFTTAINDDLNSPRALAVAWEVARGDLPPAIKRATLARFDSVFGLALETWQPPQQAIPPEIEALAQARAAARMTRNWSEADRLRDKLQRAGYDVEDTSGGYALKRR
jgi:cysteinyl-tRNA synthetase